MLFKYGIYCFYVFGRYGNVDETVKSCKENCQPVELIYINVIFFKYVNDIGAKRVVSLWCNFYEEVKDSILEEIL